MARGRGSVSSRGRRFHLAVWRWHFYAGVGVLPFVFVLALSGLAMLAAEPLDRHLQADLLTVAPRGAPLRAAEQAAAVAAAYPHAELVTFRAASAPDESAQVEIVPAHGAASHDAHGGASAVTVFVDPYAGTILGELAAGDRLYDWAKRVHGTLLLGTFGDYVIEIAAGLAVLLIATGLYLWWPREGRPLPAALLPQAGIAGRRRWRDLHAAAGAWVAPLLLLFLVSGLAWTPFWGGTLVQAWSSLPGEQFAAPLAPTTHASLDHGAHAAVPWAVEQTPLPASGSTSGAPGIALADRPIGLDDVIGYARGVGFAEFRVHWPSGEAGVWTIAATTIGGDTRALDGDRIVHLDRHTGNVLADIRFADYSPMGKLMAAGVPLHQADTGVVNLAVNVLFCLAVLGMVVAACAAWWARRPAGARRLVPPPLPRDARAWRTAVVLMLALSLAFPLAAATIAAVLAADLLLLSRVPTLRALFE
jgi:uncharacterized iron-regulated membrane protein